MSNSNALILNSVLKDFVKNAGGIAVGIVTTETLEGGPPSTDLSYVLPEAKSAVVFALPLEEEPIERFLNKQDFNTHNLDNRRKNSSASGIALEVAMFLRMLGHEAVPVASNFFYRPDVPGGRLAEKPDISHRYLAVRAGIGHFGLSGNIINKEIAAPLILGSCVTTADLFPTDPLPAEDNYCDSCKLCMSACASGLMSDTEDTTVTMGGIEFTYSMRRTYTRCDYVCGGFTGLHPSGKWSTWSPARFPIPETDEEFQPALINAVRPYVMRPKQGEGFFHALMPNNRAEFTCGHCQLLCHPDKEVRKKRYKMITSNGVVVQDADGRLKAVTPDEAKRHLEAMDTETRALYE